VKEEWRPDYSPYLCLGHGAGGEQREKVIPNKIERSPVFTIWNLKTHQGEPVLSCRFVPKLLAIPNRDTSAMYYILKNGNKNTRYVDGGETGLPDFHSVDISVSLSEIKNKKIKYLSVGASYTIDRYGNHYVILPDIGGNLLDGADKIIKSGLSFPYQLSYSEGYVCEGAINSPDCRIRTNLPDENSIQNLIEGLCVGSGFGAVYAGRYVSCLSGAKGVILTWGFTAFLGADATFGINLNYNMPTTGWNWAIEDRQKGIGLQDLIAKAE
jgi:hypothetical protein